MTMTREVGRRHTAPPPAGMRAACRRLVATAPWTRERALHSATSGQTRPTAALLTAAGAGATWLWFSDSDSATAVRRVAVATRHLAPVLAEWKLHEARVRLQGLDSDAALADASWTHTRIAERLRDMALVQGGIYVKGGQHICAQPIIPHEYVSVLRVLMSHAQRHPLCDDEQTFMEDTGMALRNAFLSFEVEPVASASLAQVYRARLLDGRQVAVKIQQRPVARFLSVDLWTIENYYALLSYLLPGLRLAWLAEETRRHMTEELDFVAERGNAAQAAALLAPEFPRSQLLIPETHPQLCGPRVLTMDWVDGCRIDDAAGLARQRADVRAIASRLQRVFGAMTFVHGFVHCDPHPGNILVTPTGCLALLDHGIYRRLSDQLRRDYCALWLAVLAGNRAQIRSCTAALGMDPEQWRFVALMLAMAPGMQLPEEGDARNSLVDDDSGAKLLAAMSNEQRAQATQRLMALTGGVAAQSALFESIPRDLLLVLKTNNLLRYVNDQLGTPINRFRITAEYAARGVRTARGGEGPLTALRVRFNSTLAPLAMRLLRWVSPGS